MELKTFLKKILLIVFLIACLALIGFFLYFIFGDEVESTISSLVPETNPIIVPQKDYSLLPVRLKIPIIKVDTQVENIGLTSKGALDVPKGPSNAGWFDLSAIPGAKGSAVMDGHAGYKNNKPAVFDNLYKLKKGDKIYVEDAGGRTVTFVVSKLKGYGINEKVSDVFFSDDGKAHLNLITCAGDWNALEKTHSKRLVVFADEEIK